MNCMQNITGLARKCTGFYKFHFISTFILAMLFNYDTALSQKNDNAVLFFIAPGISSTLSSKNSEFDKNYFYTWSPHLNFTTELIYQQLLNKQASLNSGIGMSFINYELNHNNYYLAYENENINKRISCISYKIPVFIKYTLNSYKSKFEANATFGGEINLIQAYGESSRISAGSGNDSTLSANYEPYAINASVRAGFEFNNLFKNKNLNIFTSFVYQVRPFGQITILNSYTDIGEDIDFKGDLFPKQISFYLGLHYTIFNDI